MKTTFSLRPSTVGQLIAADEITAQAKRLGLNALIDLAQDAITVKIGHGSAVALAAVLKAGSLKAARAKYYSEKACQLAAAIQHRAMLASSKVRGEAAKAETRAASMVADFAMLASMASIAAAQAWAKKNGPKAKADNDAADNDAADNDAADNDAADNDAADNDAADNGTDNNAPSSQAIEAVGQLREIKEIMARVAAETIDHDTALLQIAEVVGMAAKVNVGITLTQAKSKASKAASVKAAV